MSKILREIFWLMIIYTTIIVIIDLSFERIMTAIIEKIIKIEKMIKKDQKNGI